eukprot:CAMPEP_0171059674 /NCGR_PEP_ID=MMETSP0766_2-20121228/3335_1 /TAXON_ID=439317 /ORGANISM="Gambierdiscus australes, Strain CAWD 149" /LENGTH=348 /DNA_ID=CAMNT_0011515151 /DNA_START=77 /DNA_END=1121 /DNA_ORIENTATION=+
MACYRLLTRAVPSVGYLRCFQLAEQSGRSQATATAQDAARAAGVSEPPSMQALVPQNSQGLVPQKPHPMSLRFALTNKPFFPIYTSNLRPFNKLSKRKRIGKGMKGRGGLKLKSDRQSRKAGKTFEWGMWPLFKTLPRWPEAHMRNKRPKLEPLNLAKLRYFIEKGRLDTRFPITQRHLYESKCMRRIKVGVGLYNVNDFPFPYKIDIEVAAADQSSIDMIKAVGGTVTVVYMQKVVLRAHVKPWKYEVLPRTARPTLKLVHYLEKVKARGALVRYIKPLWLIEEERRLQTQLRELQSTEGTATAERLARENEGRGKEARWQSADDREAVGLPCTGERNEPLPQRLRI